MRVGMNRDDLILPRNVIIFVYVLMYMHMRTKNVNWTKCLIENLHTRHLTNQRKWRHFGINNDFCLMPTWETFFDCIIDRLRNVYPSTEISSYIFRSTNYLVSRLVFMSPFLLINLSSSLSIHQSLNLAVHDSFQMKTCPLNLFHTFTFDSLSRGISPLLKHLAELWPNLTYYYTLLDAQGFPFFPFPNW